MQDFIRRLLVKDQRKRLSASDCLRHPWLAQVAQTSKGAFAELNTDKLKSFLMRRRWQKAAHAIRYYSNKLFFLFQAIPFQTVT